MARSLSEKMLSDLGERDPGPGPAYPIEDLEQAIAVISDVRILLGSVLERYREKDFDVYNRAMELIERRPEFETENAWIDGMSKLLKEYPRRRKKRSKK